jgi:hypothetical protein
MDSPRTIIAPTRPRSGLKTDLRSMVRSRWARGQPVDVGQQVTLINGLRRVYETIGLERKAREVATDLPPTWARSTARSRTPSTSRRGHQASQRWQSAGRYRQELRCRYQHDLAANVTACARRPRTRRSTPDNQRNANCLIVALPLLIFLPWSLLIRNSQGPRRATLIGMLLEPALIAGTRE